MGLIRNIIFAIAIGFVFLVIIDNGMAANVNGQVTAVLQINVTNDTIRIRTSEANPDTQLIFPNRPGFETSARLFVRNFTQSIDGENNNANCSQILDSLRQENVLTRSLLIEKATALETKVGVSPCPAVACPNFTDEAFTVCRGQLANCLGANSFLQNQMSTQSSNLTGTIGNLENEASSAKLQLYFLLGICIITVGYVIQKVNYGNAAFKRDLGR